MKKKWKEMSIDELEYLPYRESINRNRDWWGYSHEKVGDYTTYQIRRRIYKVYTNQPFNDAFSHFCKIVPKHLQRDFYNEIQPRWHWTYYTYYLVDGIIKKKPENSKQVTFTSDDYKIEYFHKITRAKWKLGKFDKIIKSLKYLTEKEQQKFLEYEPVVVSGFKKTFSSANDPAYKKLVAEKNQKIKKEKKQEKLDRKNKAYCFLTKSELASKLDKEANDIKIIKHGFDLVTSFRD